MRSESINTGNRFKKWCKAMGRSIPPADVVDALNISMDTGGLKIKEYLPTKPEIWKNYCTFLSGKGHGRV